MSNRPADFSNRIRMTIAWRCGNRCSNPDCRKSTLEEDGNGILYSVGIASHIEAASPGGARYNPASSLEERRSIDNALWLCPTCSVMIDRDPETYTVSLLRQWKRMAESGNHTAAVRIFAVANGSGGVGTSSVTAYLAQALAAVTGERTLCISVNAWDDVGKILFGADWQDGRPMDGQSNVAYISDEAFSRMYLDQQTRWGKLTLNDLIQKENYRFILIDCGGLFDYKELALFQLATDLILPAGEHVHTARGMEMVGRYLQKTDHKVSVWPLFSQGLSLSNTGYKLKWFQAIHEVLDRLEAMDNVTVKHHGIVIPRSSYVGIEGQDLFEDPRTRHVAGAYMELAERMLERGKANAGT